MNARNGRAVTGTTRQSGTVRQAGTTRQSGAARKAAGLVGVGSAALASAGLAIIASQGSVPVAHAEQAGVQPAKLTASLGGTPSAPGGGASAGTGQALDPANLTPAPAPGIQVAPAPQRAGTATFSGGAGVSVPFTPDGGLGLANFFGLLNVTPPPLGGLSTGGSLPLNFSSSALPNPLSPPPAAPDGLSAPSIFQLDPAYNGLINTITQQQNDAAVQDAAGQVDRSLQFIDSIPVGAPASMDMSADPGTRVAAGDPLQAFQLAADGGVQLAQNNQPSVTLTYPDGSSQTFPMPSGNGAAQLFAPLGSTITLPSGNTMPLNDPGLLTVVPPAGSGANPLPVQILPMDKIPMSDGTDGAPSTATAAASSRSVVADATPTAPETAPAPDVAPAPDSAPPVAPPAPVADTVPQAPAPDVVPPAPGTAPPAADTVPPVPDATPPAPETAPDPVQAPAPVVAYDVPTGGSFGGSGSA